MDSAMCESVVSEAASSPLGVELRKIVDKYRHRASCTSDGEYKDGYSDAVEDMVSDLESLLGIHAGGYLD